MTMHWLYSNRPFCREGENSCGSLIRTKKRVGDWNYGRYYPCVGNSTTGNRQVQKQGEGGCNAWSCSLRILADMLLGPVDLLVSSWSRSSSISSSVHRGSAGISSGSSSLLFKVNGGLQVLKQLVKKLLSKAAFS